MASKNESKVIVPEDFENENLLKRVLSELLKTTVEITEVPRDTKEGKKENNKPTKSIKKQ